MTDRHEHITCQEVVELVTDYLEGELPADEATVFEQHLNFCDGCIFYVEQIRRTIDAAGRVGEEDVPEHVREGLMTAFRDWRGSR